MTHFPIKFKIGDNMKNNKICVICKQRYEGYGNNSQPFTIGRCCDACNYRVVVPYKQKVNDNENMP